MGWHDDEDEAATGWWTEPVAWAICLVVAVMPTAVLGTLAQIWDRAAWPLFAPLLYIGMFTLMVTIVRPWTLR